MISVLIKILASVFIFSLVIFIHELGHFATAKFSGIKVNEFAIGMGPTIFKFTKGETVYAIRLFPIGGFVSMEGEDESSEDERSFSKAPIRNRILVLVAGATMNILLGFLVLNILVIDQPAITSKVIGEFLPNSSTQKSGLMVGDEILAVNGRRCFIANDLIYEFVRTQDGVADLTVKRGEEKVEIKNVIFNTTENKDGVKEIDVDFKVMPTEKSFFGVIKEAGLWTCSLARMVFLSLVDLVTGRIPVNSLAGPVGVVTVISDAVSYGWQSIAMVLSLITINLGIFNLLPLPALDGGRLFLLVIEAIRRKPIKEKYEILINTIGFGLLMTLMLFATYNDIARLLK